MLFVVLVNVKLELDWPLNELLWIPKMHPTTQQSYYWIRSADWISPIWPKWAHLDSHSIPQAPVIWEWVVANYTLQTRLVLFTSHCLGMAMHTHLNTHIWLLCVCVCVFQSVDANLVFLRVCVFVYVCNYVRLQSFWLMLACVCVCFACVCFVSSRSGAHASTSV